MEQKKHHGRSPQPSPASHRAERKAGTQTKDRSEARTRRSTPERAGASANFLSIQARRLTRRVRRLRRHIQDLRQENQACNFPESDALPVQLLLLGWNMLPMLGSLIWERISRRRKQFFRWVSDQFARIRWKKLHPAAFIGGGDVYKRQSLHGRQRFTPNIVSGSRRGLRRSHGTTGMRYGI